MGKCTQGGSIPEADVINPVPTADQAAWAEFRQRFAAHLARFGHTIYDLDFAKAVPADDPAALLETFKFFLSGEAPDPQARQAKAAASLHGSDGAWHTFYVVQATQDGVTYSGMRHVSSADPTHHAAEEAYTLAGRSLVLLRPAARSDSSV